VDRSGLRVDEHAVHRREVDHESAVADGAARDVVAAAPNRERQSGLPREVHGGDDVGRTGTARDDRRISVDHSVPELSRLVVPCVARQHELAAHVGGERRDLVVRQVVQRPLPR